MSGTQTRNRVFKRVYTVGELRRVIEGLPDDMPVLTPALDHRYASAYARLMSVDFSNGEYLERDCTPEGEFLDALVVE